MALLIISVLLSIVVMMQEGKGGGLSAVSGNGESYWSKNKGKSKDAVLAKITIVLGIAFMVVALLISSKFI
ncbi:MAG: preprotein translocase subunit SecG [Lachnospiraceae bacterium]|nr:preprotein translocase subunit SecG [Lachnospiraceae bacterium]